MSWGVYPKYKATATLDSVPDHWRVSKLRHLLKVNPSVPEELRSEGDRMVTFLPMEAVGEDGALDTTRERPVSELLTGYSYFTNGDVIMAKVTPCFENGKAAVIEALPTTDGFGTSEVTTLRPGTDLDQRFLGYFVRSDRFRQSSIAAMTGAGGLKRVPDEHVRTFEVGLPPDAEQIGIVDFLDRETAKIDALIAKQEQLIATLREDRAATITQAVTKGLDPDVETTDSDVGGFIAPARWTKSVALKRVVSVQTGLTLGRTVPPDSAVILPYLRVANVQAGRVDLSQITTVEVDRSEVEKYTLRAGDVLMTEGGDIDKLGRGCLWQGEIDRCLHQNHVFAVRCSSRLEGKFLVYLLDTVPARNYFMLTAKKTTNLASTNSTTLGRFPFALPSVGEQLEIVDFLDARCATMDGLIAKSTEMIDTLREYRSALITDAVTGKIDVRGVA